MRRSKPRGTLRTTKKSQVSTSGITMPTMEGYSIICLWSHSGMRYRQTCYVDLFTNSKTAEQNKIKLGSYKSKPEINFNMLRQDYQGLSSSLFVSTLWRRLTTYETAYQTKKMLQEPPCASQDSRSPLKSGRIKKLVAQYTTYIIA